jgi:hypothetical protein
MANTKRRSLDSAKQPIVIKMATSHTHHSYFRTSPREATRLQYLKAVTAIATFALSELHALFRMMEQA